MLVLKCNTENYILITDMLTNEQIKISLNKAKGQLRLGFEASQRYQIKRGKVVDKIQQSQPLIQSPALESAD